MRAKLYALLVLIYILGAATAQIVKPPVQVVLKMRDGAGNTVTRNYETLNTFNYNAYVLTVDFTNPTVYRCGFEP